MEAKTRFKRLQEVSEELTVDESIPIARYFRSGREMLKMANIYRNEGEYEKAFILYMKYITLFVQKIREHPEFKEANVIEKKWAKDKCKEVFPLAEELKVVIMKKYEDEYDAYIKEKRKREADEREKQLKLEKENQLKREKREALEKEQLLLKFEEAKERQNALFVDVKPSAPIADNLNRGEDLEINVNSMRNSTPTVDRTTKPSHLLSFHHDEKLRKIFVPNELVTKFLLIAEPNTLRNVETCGILAGKLSHNSFTITHVLIPSQTGTSDSCQTAKEEIVFTFQDENDLMTLGWIHTHPSQSSFMSSIDLHTHCSYQLMLSEAIAIVCSPKYNQIGIYSLTHNYGLNFIANCAVTGFHPHPKEPPIYEESKHVIFDNKPIQIIDLR